MTTGFGPARPSSSLIVVEKYFYILRVNQAVMVHFLFRFSSSRVTDKSGGGGGGFGESRSRVCQLSETNSTKETVGKDVSRSTIDDGRSRSRALIPEPSSSSSSSSSTGGFDSRSKFLMASSTLTQAASSVSKVLVPEPSSSEESRSRSGVPLRQSTSVEDHRQSSSSLVDKITSTPKVASKESRTRSLSVDEKRRAAVAVVASSSGSGTVTPATAVRALPFDTSLSTIKTKSSKSSGSSSSPDSPE